MTPPEFSVLLLAWDDADPSVAVLGGAALPPTLPLVYELAAQQPVLAVYPHLPPAGAARPAPETGPSPPAPLPSNNPANAVAILLEPAATPEIIGALETAVPMPGVRLLPSLLPAQATADGRPLSRLVGLDELALTVLPPSLPPAGPAPTPNNPGPTAIRSQWPMGVNAPATAQWLAPAAPYLGASAAERFPVPPGSVAPTALLPAAGSRPASLAPATRPFLNSLHVNGRPHAGDLHFDPDPELPPVRHPEAFDEPTKEIGPAEARGVSAPADDLLPDAPLVATAVAVEIGISGVPAKTAVVALVATDASAPTTSVPLPAAAAVPAAPVVLAPAPDGLNFRMIQYARRAAHLVQGRSDFGVIYAPCWPAWLAALEIRNSSRRPLVLYAASLATDLANPAEHGYQLEMERMTMRRAALILVPDEGVRRRLQILYQDTIGKVRVVPPSDETTVRQLLAELVLAAG